ncbi:MAG: polyprenyl diphosphate synthase [Myxococcota bacterium]
MKAVAHFTALLYNEHMLQSHPRHIAVIMDGNRRWATQAGLSHIYGHRRGAKRALQLVQACQKLGIPYLTLYAFSTENWHRSKQEVHDLMQLLQRVVQRYGDKLIRQNNIALSIIGDRSRLPNCLQQQLTQLCEQTANNSGLRLTIALSYGSRDEITRATRHLCQDVLMGKLKIQDIQEELIATYLDTYRLPDPDLLIRTSGEMRLSNFLLWQLAYTELYVTPTLWPNFSRLELEQALQHFYRRTRRFGGGLSRMSSQQATAQQVCQNG